MAAAITTTPATALRRRDARMRTSSPLIGQAA